MIRDARAVAFWQTRYAFWVGDGGMTEAVSRKKADTETVEFAKRFCTLDERVEVEDTLRKIEEGNVSDE